MKQYLTEKGIKLWVVDNLASLTPGIDENIKKDWDPINAWLLELRYAGISTVMLHHTGKEGKQRGTSAREDNIDISIELKKPEGYTPDCGAKFTCHFSKARVGMEGLVQINDMIFHLQEKDGRMVWTHRESKTETKVTVLRMLDEGINNKKKFKK